MHATADFEPVMFINVPAGHGRGTVPAKQYVPSPQFAGLHTAPEEVDPAGIAYPSFNFVPFTHDCGTLSALAPLQ